MKKSILSFILALGSLGAGADVIVMTDGTTMQVHNVEPASKWIYYTESPDADAPIKKMAIDKVFAYKIGEEQMTTVASAPTTAASSETSSTSQTQPVQEAAAQNGPRKLDPAPAPDNASLIAAYNNHPPLTYIGKNPNPDKYTSYFLSLWGIEEGSVLSDANVEIGFETVYLENDKDRSVIGHRIKVINKTDKPIYIDLASCYKIMNGGYSVPYFTNSVYSEGSNTTKGGALNMGAVAGALGVGGALGTLAGGINVGGATTQSTSITTTEQQVITIPPHSLACLPGEKFSTGKEIKECYEPIFFYNKVIGESYAKSYAKSGYERGMTICLDQKAQKIADDPNATRESLNVRHWIQTDFTPETTPKKIGRIITYSTSPDFSTYTSLPVNLYMRGAFGMNMNSMSSVHCYFNDKTYDCITDKEHFIVGGGHVKKK